MIDTMTIHLILERRIDLIEKSTSIYFSQYEQKEFGINFIYYISIFFLALGIIYSLLSSMNVSVFNDRWVNSGLFYLCTLPFQLKVFGYAKHILLKKHKIHLKQILNKTTDSDIQFPDSLNAEFEKEIRSKSISFMHILLGSLAVLGGISFIYNFEFWKHFDLLILLIWSLYAILCFHKIQKLKQSISTFNLELKTAKE